MAEPRIEQGISGWGSPQMGSRALIWLHREQLQHSDYARSSAFGSHPVSLGFKELKKGGKAHGARRGPCKNFVHNPDELPRSTRGPAMVGKSSIEDVAYFLKVVPTHRQFRTLDGKIINTHQYSTTQCERDTHPGNAISSVFAQPKKGGEAHARALLCAEEEISHWRTLTKVPDAPQTLASHPIGLGFKQPKIQERREVHRIHRGPLG
ncbi:hypothetical protein B0H16DRAFT_1472250 [Mycena metata]|uniref:Uncharacterized protein n=1 Tax=Mycena metata TaxID=1033252 RepID=A0AAD7MNB0_9AGAR|nr:hypothetical protein B0H16DRAFT_1472250 [Mycena metata]